jgi:3-oxoadipate enol-lactonase/4-carboxymuconolactone decarboxylase
VRLEPTPLGGAASAPLLILGPSLGTTAESLWSAAAELLTDRFRLVGWDLPGHGRSAPGSGFDIAALAAGVLSLAGDLTGNSFYYAGDSMGGAVGLQLLLDAPERVAAATLLCTSARIGEPAAWHERAALVRAEGTSALLDAAAARWFGARVGERVAVRKNE